MKNIIRLISFLTLAAFLTGCFEDGGTDVLFDNSKAFVEIQETSITGANRKVYTVIPDGQSVSDNITVAYGGPAPASDVTVNFEFLPDESTAIEGVDFDFVSAGSVTIPAGSFTAPLNFTVVDDLLDPDADPKTLTIRLTSTTAGQISPNYQKITLTLTGICPGELFDFDEIPGTYSVITDASSTDSCPANTVLDNFAGEMTITYISGSVEDGEFVFELEDSFAGVYIDWYGDCYGYTFATDNQITLDVATGAITGSWSSAFTGDSFDANGTFDFCNGRMTVHWVNAFGDEGETIIETLE